MKAEPESDTRNREFYLGIFEDAEAVSDLTRCFCEAFPFDAKHLRFVIRPDDVFTPLGIPRFEAHMLLDAGDMRALNASHIASAYFRGATHANDPKGYLEVLRKRTTDVGKSPEEVAADILIETEFGGTATPAKKEEEAQ